MKTKILILMLVVVLILAATSVALADNVEMPGWVLGSGASESAALNISLRATLGQPVVGIVAAGDVSLGQGFWHGGVAVTVQNIYLPMVIR